MAHHRRPAHDPTALSTDASQFLPKLSLETDKAERHFLERCLPLPGTLIADEQGGSAGKSYVPSLEHSNDSPRAIIDSLPG
jgi:hypothetical protein